MNVKKEAQETADRLLKDLKEKLNEIPRDRSAIPTSDLLSTGNTLLNLACSGKAKGGISKGHYYLLAGESGSGKTFQALTILAEATLNKNFSKHKLIYDGPENGALMDIESFFGKNLAKRLETPEPSSTVEGFYFSLDDLVEENKPFIYVLDSMDALNSEEDEKHHEESKIAFEKDKEAKGTYGTAKAKANKQGLLRLMSPLKESGSILIIISHLTDKIGFGFEKNYRAGGKALKYFATLEIWFSLKEKIKKRITTKGKSKDHDIGSIFQIKIKKDRTQGKHRVVDVVFHESVGFDDLETQIDYLLSEGHWEKGKGGINAEEFNFTGSQEELIKHIETNDLEPDLRSLTAKVWDEIEQQCAVHRKKRYE